MKRINKILLLISAVCASVGIVLLVIGFFMGVSLEQLQDAVQITAADFSFRTEEREENRETAMDRLEEEKGYAETYSGVKELDMKLNVGYFELEVYDGEDIEVLRNKKDGRTQVVQDGKTLKIQQSGLKIFGRHLRNQAKNHAVKILIPENYLFDSVKIRLGAAEGKCGAFRTDELDVDIDAGVLEMKDSVQASESKLSADAGTISAEQLRSRKTELDCNAGEISVILDGEEKDYELKGEVNVGCVSYGEAEWDQISEKFRQGDGDEEKQIDISCNAGEVTVEFSE